MSLPSLPEVLIADDEFAICFSLSAFLRPLGFKTHVAANGVAALEVLRKGQGKVRLAFLDLRMPLMTGLDAARTVLEEKLLAQCCLTSAFHRDLVRSVHEEIFALAKPFDFEQFELVFAEMLDEDRIACERFTAQGVEVPQLL